MAEFHCIFCCPFLLSVLLIEGWVGWMAGQGGVGGDKNPCLGHPMSNHNAHIVANDTPVGDIDQWEQTQVPTAQLVPSICMVPLFQP